MLSQALATIILFSVSLSGSVEGARIRRRDLGNGDGGTERTVRRKTAFRELAIFGQKPFFTCRQNLLASDMDGDLEIGPDEFASFIFLQSNGQITGNAFWDLDLSFVSIFYSEACFQCAAKFNCCSDYDNTFIDIDENRQGIEKLSSSLTFLCTSVHIQITDMFPSPTPTVSPVTSSSETLSTESDAPTMSPSMISENPSLSTQSPSSSGMPSMISENPSLSTLWPSSSGMPTTQSL